MDNDDTLVGRLLNRREILLLAGALGTAAVVGCGDSNSPATPTAPTTPVPAGKTAEATATAAPGTSAAATMPASIPVPACVVVPALTEGPYFVDEKLNRSDIRSEPSTGAVKDGAVLSLTFMVSGLSGASCAALAGTMVDVWHCDALGVYSDATDPSFNTQGQKFLRGYQVTDASGKAAFTTIIPGWYHGRAVHIHFKLRGATTGGKSYEFTSQLFFDDAFIDGIQAQAPYAAKGKRTLRNAGDAIYNQSKGLTLLNVTKSGSAYAATFEVGVQL
jgi:protocatechuate 3,4-dioxygenase beta subunit